jgi:hypothetical protein
MAHLKRVPNRARRVGIGNRHHLTCGPTSVLEWSARMGVACPSDAQALRHLPRIESPRLAHALDATINAFTLSQ